MNHPTPEEMMDHLYGENAHTHTHSRSRDQSAAVEAHLRVCAECRTQVAAWRQAMSELDAWRLPSRSARSGRRLLPVILRWAAAAAILISAGFLAGRSASPLPAALEGSILAALRQEVSTQVAGAIDRERATLAAELRATASESAGQETRQFLASFAEQIDERRQADAEAFSIALQQSNARHAQAIARLRQDLSTVAVVADARLLDTQEQLLELADVYPVGSK